MKRLFADSGRTKKIIIITGIILMSFIIFYARHFLFSKQVKIKQAEINQGVINQAKINQVPTVQMSANQEPTNKESANKESIIQEPTIQTQANHEKNHAAGDHIEKIFHEALTVNIGGYTQKVNLITVIPDNKISIKPALAYGSIFGFETLKTIAQRNEAYAAVNGGFFYEYGQPTGLVVIDGRIVSGTSGKCPVFIYNGESARLEQKEVKLWIECGENKIMLDNINTIGIQGQAVVYTRDFAPDNRGNISNISITVVNNIITDVKETDGSTEIPKDGMVITFYKPLDKSINLGCLLPGNNIELKTLPVFMPGDNAYECGSWIIRDNQIIAPEKDDWVGILTTRDPRTAVGIKENGNVVFITIDGRQPGYSMGVTAYELGEYLLSHGVRDAAMLDGGASTEMVVNGTTVNRPSNNGESRPIAGGIIIKRKF